MSIQAVVFDIGGVLEITTSLVVGESSAKGTAEQPGKNVAAKAGLNREIGRSGWGALVKRLEDKAPGRVQKVPAAYTSQRCSACGHVARENRESQAVFLCTACGYACNADVNAARVIAAGHAVNAREATPLGGLRTANLNSRSWRRSWNPPPSSGGGCQSLSFLPGPWIAG